MDVHQLIVIHLELECVGVDSSSHLRCIDCPNPDSLPRFYIARHADGCNRYFRSDLPADLEARLTLLDPETALHDPEVVQRILAPCDDIHLGKSYGFPVTLTPADYLDAVQVSAGVFGIVINGEVVSTCESARENYRAGEAWVQTLPAFRGRGYAVQVCAALGAQSAKAG